ncbi:MAG: SHOCT domain-containing protein [Acidimicrobiales bacterium]
MMQWGAFWPLLMLIPVMILVGLVFMATVMRSSGSGRSCGPMGWRFMHDRSTDSLPDSFDVAQARPDPLEVLRERYATGEIDHDEFDKRLEGLVSSEPPASTHAAGRARH